MCRMHVRVGEQVRCNGGAVVFGATTSGANTRGVTDFRPIRQFPLTQTRSKRVISHVGWIQPRSISFSACVNESTAREQRHDQHRRNTAWQIRQGTIRQLANLRRRDERGQRVTLPPRGEQARASELA